MRQNCLVDLQEISFEREGSLILDHISFRVEEKKILTIIGPNGAGKTTLLKILLGLLPSYSGSVMRKENLVVGYMPQRIYFDQSLPLTVMKFLSLSEQKIPPLKALGFLNAEALADKSIHVLSGGEFQRVLLARALLRQPQLLVLDEPGQGLDVLGQNELFQFIKKLKDQLGCAILLVSHDLHFVHSSSDQVICLNRHICCAGSPEDIQSMEEYKSLFPGLTPAALAPYVHDHDHTHDASTKEYKP